MKLLYTKTLKISAALIIMILLAFQGMAQENDSITKAKMDSLAAIQTAPVPQRDYERSAFENGVLIDAQTATIPARKSLEFMIQHRFGEFKNNQKDLYGVWGASNIRLGLNFSILDNLQAGVGIMKTKKMTDFQLKYNPFRQTRDNKIPVTVTLYGNWAIDGRSKDAFGIDSARLFADRYSYYSELIISRRFGSKLSLQGGLSFAHYNFVDTTGGERPDHDKIGLSVAGRFKFSPQSSIMVACEWPLKIKQISEYTKFVNPPHPNFQIGWEISTGTHQFQIFAEASQGIIPQENMMWNQSTFSLKNIKGQTFLLGLNISRLYSFK